MNHRVFLLAAVLSLFLPHIAGSQMQDSFDVSFRVDFESADELLQYFEHRSFNVARLMGLRGNQLAASTSLLLARTQGSDAEFRRALEAARDGVTLDEDRYGLADAQRLLPLLRKLLDESKRRQLDRRVRATLASYFPSDQKFSATIPVYVVAFGNERAAAFVRRVVWNGDSPVFVGDNEGEPVIVLNLARCIRSNSLDEQFTEMLATLAHECFHAVFSLYRQQHGLLRPSDSPMQVLADLVQNEGIAYYISMQIQIGGSMPSQPWFTATGRSVNDLFKAFAELSSPRTSRDRAEELILNSNLSGSFESNYGATAGLRIAYEIDTQLNRMALTETVEHGTADFFRKYQLIARRAGLPPLTNDAGRALGISTGKE